MPTYEKGTAGKLIVQDWNVLATYSDENSLRYIQPRQMAALVALAEFLGWKTRYLNPPDTDALEAFKAETIYNLMTEIQFCEKMIECIENDEDVSDALAQWFSYAVDNNTIVQQALQRAFDPSKGGTEVPQQYADKNQYGSALGCDNDDGWGHIRGGLIERSFQRVIDVLERIEFVTDNQEMLAEFVNAIPGVGALFDVIPVTDWILWFDNVRAWMKEAFEAGDTTELRDQIACDLFCIWQENCSLSFEQIRTYYWEKTKYLVPSWENAFTSMSELATALGYLSEVSFGDAVVYALVGSQYGFLTFINDWFGIHVNVVGNDLAIGEPSDDWMTICPICPELWEFVIDFETGENVEFVDVLIGDYELGVGVHSVFFDSGGNLYRVLVLTWTTDSASELVHYEIDADYSAGSLASTGDSTFYFRWNNTTPITSVITPTQPAFPETWDGSDLGGAASTLGVQIMPGVNFSGGGDPGGSALLRRITLRGYGTPPV